MAPTSSLLNIWQVVKEADLRPLRDQALQEFKLAIVGDPGTGRSTLAAQMRRDPARQEASSDLALTGISTAVDTPIQILDLDSAGQAEAAHLIILMMSSRKADSSREQALVQRWNAAGKRVMVFINQMDEPSGEISVSGEQPAAVKEQKSSAPGRRRRGVVWGSALDTRFLVERFAPAVMELLPDQLLSLARSFPLFRVPVARFLINDTSFSNAAYALSTGLAEIVAIADVPVVVADSVILTKNQLFLAYKVGLALGYSTRWQDYIAEFGSVLGSGFIFRQVARSLIGLVPVIGIVPKTAIAYAGTYVVGNAVLQWYLTGRHITTDQMKEVYQQALEQGRRLGGVFLRRRKQTEAQALPSGEGKRWYERLPRLRLPRFSRPARLPRLTLRRKPATPQLPSGGQVCPACGKVSSPDAQFCQYCGKALGV